MVASAYRIPHTMEVVIERLGGRLFGWGWRNGNGFGGVGIGGARLTAWFEEAYEGKANAKGDRRNHHNAQQG